MIGATGTTWPLRYCLDRAEAYRYFGTTDGGEADIDFVTGTPRVIYQSEPTDETLGTRNFLMAPLPNQNSLYTDGNYRIFIPYWKYLALLSASGDQNWFTVNAEEWLTYQAASLAFLANEDEQAAAAWAQVAASKYQDVLSTDKDSRVADAGEVLIPRRDADRPKYAQGLNHRWPWGWGRRF
jgi:hypothetical protein